MNNNTSQKLNITVTEYNADEIYEYSVHSLETLGKNKEGSIRWIDIDNECGKGLSEQLSSLYNIHPVVLENISEKKQRPKLEDYEDFLFAIATMLYKKNEFLVAEGITFLLGDDYVISIGDLDGDVFDTVRKEIYTPKSHIRRSGPDYLLYRLLDSITDSYFETLYDIEERIDLLEEEIIRNASTELLARIRAVKSDNQLVSKSIIPFKESRSILINKPSKFITPSVTPYMNEVYEHIKEAIELSETYREMIMDLMELFYTSTSYKLNEIIKVLTIISTIFIPLTFIVGVYGMNFKYIPELYYKWSYPVLWGIMLIITGLMIYYFKKKKWF